MGFPCFSAIARSVMISALFFCLSLMGRAGFSAIARSVMISAFIQEKIVRVLTEFQCYSS